MSINSKIEWTETTWNPVTGCTKISSGCANCYAEKMANRLKLMGLGKYSKGFELSLHYESLKEPYKWKKGRLVFVCSMSDLFHEDVSYEFIEKVFSVMTDCHQHIFQVLTKRSHRLREFSRNRIIAPNIWTGVTVESAEYRYRINDLNHVNAAVKFLSLEPLIGPIYALDLDNIDWVIVGGESGPKSRFMNKEWVVGIKDQCLNSSVPFFFKQWGGKNKKKSGRELDERIYSEMPEVFSLI